MSSMNSSCNYENPINFAYPLTTSQEGSDTPFFVVFDSDSLPNNKEILMQTTYIGGDTKYDLVNISNSDGDDIKPDLAFVSIGDTGIYVDIIWEHSQNNKTDIWNYLIPYNPVNSDVRDGKNSIYNFELAQNYPNPFNPSTIIKFAIPSVGNSLMKFVQLKVYDILGNEVATLLNKEKLPGNYEAKFDGSNLASGVYFYKLSTQDFVSVKKMLLLK